MTITPDDLRAAVAQGLMTEEQSAQLIGLSDARRAARSSIGAIEEPFVLFKGFNEIFVVIGLVILFSGWSGVALLLGLDMWQPNGLTTILLSAITLAGLAGVSRYFTLKRRMVAPSIALVVMTALTATVLGYALVPGMAMAQSSALVALIVAGVMGLHYRMFRVPFSAAVIASALFFALWSALEAAGIVQSSDVLLPGVNTGFSLMTILFGLAAFALAMRLDLSDPLRVSTRSSTAFWLHVVAAPAIVNTVAVNLLTAGGAVSQALLLGFLLIIAVVAIVIDRRSFLVSGAGYSVALAATAFDGGAPIAILILGGVLVLLGAQWDRLRASLMNALPDFAGKSNLPPYAVKA
jgi:hypothetical protein